MLLVSDEWKHETACNISQPWNKKLGSLLNINSVLVKFGQLSWSNLINLGLTQSKSSFNSNGENINSWFLRISKSGTAGVVQASERASKNSSSLSR